MPTLINKKHRPEIAEEKDSNGINLPANCLLMSEDGFKFKINEQLLNQTKIMSDIIEDSNDSDCSGIIKIFFLCQGDDLKQLVKFLCDGKIQCENEQDCMKILKDLKNMFGFLDEDLDCQKIDYDQKETNEKMAKISEVPTEKVPETNCSLSTIKNKYESVEKTDNIDGETGEKSTESKIKSEEKVAVSEAQAGKNIPKIYREISPIKSKKGKSRKKMIAKSISEGKKEQGSTTGEVPKNSPTTDELSKMDCSTIKNLDSSDLMDTIDGKIGEKSTESKMKSEEKVTVEKTDNINGETGEKSTESKIKSEEKIAVSEAKAKNIPKIYWEISPIKSKKGKTRKMIAKSKSGGKKEESGEIMAVSEGPTIGEVPKMDCSSSPIKNLDLSEKMDTIDEKIGEEKSKESMSGDNTGPNEIMDVSEKNKDSKMDCNPINEVESVVKLEKKSSKKGFFTPWKPPPQKLVIVEDEEYEGNQKVLTQL